MAGYSQKTLIEKLGVKEYFSILLGHATANYNEEFKVNISTNFGKEKFNFIQSFFTEKSQFEVEFPELIKHLQKNGMLWISWPKKSRV